jgi:molecular chaperone GrpE
MAFGDPNTAPPRPEASRDEDTSVRVIDRRWWARAAAGDTGEDEAPRESDKPVYVQELEQRLVAKDDELRATIARYREASNEFDEMRARIRRDTAREAERNRRQVFADLLEVIDNLDRAIDAARTAHAAPALLQGVELVRSQFLGKFESHGVTRVVSLGQRFDPERHEAATTVPVSDPHQDGIVVGIIREGYTMAGDMLRPAMVAVGRLTNEGAVS